MANGSLLINLSCNFRYQILELGAVAHFVFLAILLNLRQFQGQLEAALVNLFQVRARLLFSRLFKRTEMPMNTLEKKPSAKFDHLHASV